MAVAWVAVGFLTMYWPELKSKYWFELKQMSK
jgi:hypothetical protein